MPVPALSFQATAGLSLGEFTALTAAGAISFEEGLKVVRQRGRFMQEACETTRGGMAAIIGLDEAPTREVCAQAGVASRYPWRGSMVWLLLRRSRAAKVRWIASTDASTNCS